MVRHSLVLDGLIIASGAWLATGISAAATPELNGPTMPRTLVLEMICWTFWAPLVGSCLPLTASSNGVNFSVKPLRLPACETAKAAPYCVSRPLEASAPEVGRSLAISISPLLPPPPPPVLPQAKATIVATVRTTSPLARTIWFPLVLVGRPAQTTPNASHHLPPSSQPSRGESAPAASAATWDGRTATPRQTIDAEGPTSQVEPERLARSAASIR